MYALMKAELLKQKHSFHKKLVWLSPIVTIFIAIILMGEGYIQSASYNWWYTIILPASLTIISSFTIVNEQKGKFHGLFSSLVHIKKLWYSKIIVCTLYLALTCLTFFIGIILSGVLFGSQISLIDSFIASLILFILYAWQIPLWMYLSMKVNISFSVILSLICNFGIAVIFAVKTVWWIPFAIPARLMCSIIGILPNGLNVDGGSYLLNANVIPVGIFINVTLYVVLSYLTAKCFEKQEI